MNVLVTGGLGFIGSRIAAEHLRRGDNVTIVDNLLEQVHADDRMAKEMSALGAEVLVRDVRDPDVWDALVPRVSWIYHMAADTGTGQSMSEIVRYCDTNVRSTALLCEALAAAHAVQRVFLPSSRAIYGEGLYRCESHGVVSPGSRKLDDLNAGYFHLACPQCGGRVEPAPTHEDAPMRPVSVYASTKAMQEWLLRQTCERLGVSLRIARYQNVYGPGQSLKNPYTGVLAVFATKILRGEMLPVFEDGEILRDFVYIDDTVSSSCDLMALAECDEPVNVGTGRAVSMVDVVRAFARAAKDRDVRYAITGEFRFGDIRAAYADTVRLRRVLGDRIFVSVEEGVERFFSRCLPVSQNRQSLESRAAGAQ